MIFKIHFVKVFTSELILLIFYQVCINLVHQILDVYKICFILTICYKTKINLLYFSYSGNKS